MSHARQIIREAVASILATNPTAWSSVTETRIQSLQQIWPYVMVFSDGESSEALVINSPTTYERSVIISTVGLLRLPGTGDTSSIEDSMDDVAAEIETKLTTTTLRAVVSKVKTLELLATKIDVVMETDGIDHGEILLTWRVTYNTVEGTPSTLV